MARSLADPDSGSHGPETRHMFCQDSDPVREFGTLNVVYHSIRTQLGLLFTAVAEGTWIVARPKSGGKGGGTVAAFLAEITG